MTARDHAAQALISKLILDEIARLGHGKYSVREAIDNVLGEGTSERLIDELYLELRAA